MDNSDGMTGAASAPEDASRRMKDAAGTVLERTKQVAAETAERGKETVAASVQTAASSLRRAAEQTRDENALIGKALSSFADGLEKASHTIQGGDLNRALGEVNAFARREPAIFLGASLALGFALARVGKAAMERGAESVPQSTPPPTYDAIGG